MTGFYPVQHKKNFTKVSLQDKILLGIHCQLKLFDLVTLDFGCKVMSCQLHNLVRKLESTHGLAVIRVSIS